MKRQPAQTYHDITPDYLRNKLKLKHFQESLKLGKTHPNALKYLQSKGVDLGNIREHSAKIIGMGALTGAFLLGTPKYSTLPTTKDVISDLTTVKEERRITMKTKQETLLAGLKEILPTKTRPLTTDEEKKLEVILRQATGISAKGTLEGEHLNTTYGLIGAEQHLRRYPGDTMATHPKVPQGDEGMAPGLGGFGYFAKSKSALTPTAIEEEKWYVVAQLMYLPDWKQRVKYLVPWYKHRKILVVNTQNGNAVVGDMGDAGPAAWTGKSFGGSPEVMNALGGARYKKGPVLFFFIDDPEHKIPLGPVDYNTMDLTGISLHQL